VHTLPQYTESDQIWLCSKFLKASASQLGVIIDSKLSFNSHISALSKKANGTRAFLPRSIKCQDKQVKTQAYNQYVRPTLKYAASAWYPHTRKNTDKLEQVEVCCQIRH